MTTTGETTTGPTGSPGVTRPGRESSPSPAPSRRARIEGLLLGLASGD
ncbi:ADP-ribosylglycohydrolase family protein, partial [Streptomyces globisporus]